jgi:PKD repeat protein
MKNYAIALAALLLCQTILASGEAAAFRADCPLDISLINGQSEPGGNAFVLHANQTGTWLFDRTLLCNISVQPVAFRVDWGDGSSSNGTSDWGNRSWASHRYSRQGIYAMKVAMNKSYGAIAQVEKRVNVLPLPEPDCGDYDVLHQYENLSDGTFTMALQSVERNGTAHYSLLYGSYSGYVEVPFHEKKYMSLPDGNKLVLENCKSYLNVSPRQVGNSFTLDFNSSSHASFSLIGPPPPQNRPLEMVWALGRGAYYNVYGQEPGKVFAKQPYFLFAYAHNPGNGTWWDLDQTLSQGYGFRVDWGDGGKISARDGGVYQEFSHIYQSPGLYNISISEIDPLGRCSQAFTQVRVAPSSQQPAEPQSQTRCPHYPIINLGKNLTAEPYSLILQYVRSVSSRLENNRHEALFALSKNGEEIANLSVLDNSTLYFNTSNGDMLKIDVCLNAPGFSLNAMWSAVKFSIIGAPLPPNQPPIITGIDGPLELNATEPGKWTVKAHDPEGVWYLSQNEVDWGDGSQNEFSQPSHYLWHAYSKQGTYAVNFTARDDYGAASSIIVQVNVKAWPEESLLQGCNALYAINGSGQMGIVKQFPSTLPNWTVLPSNIPQQASGSNQSAQLQVKNISLPAGSDRQSAQPYQQNGFFTFLEGMWQGFLAFLNKV